MTKIRTTKEDDLKRGIWNDKTWDRKKIKSRLLKEFGRCFWCGQYVSDIKDVDAPSRAVIHYLITSFMGRKKDEVTPKVLLCLQCAKDRESFQQINYKEY